MYPLRRGPHRKAHATHWPQRTLTELDGPLHAPAAPAPPGASPKA
jgi:hypothetical protein